jgi:probable rRNA maturation factor
VVRLTIEYGPHAGLPRVEILRRAQVITRALQLTQYELSIVLTKDDTVQKLNLAYRHLDQPTDVLAFAMHEAAERLPDGSLLGDVIVSVETARAQAKRANRDVLEEVTMLLAHGTLHLLGWDHDTLSKDRKMRAETARLCRLAAAPARRAASGSRRAKPSSKKPSSAAGHGRERPFSRSQETGATKVSSRSR